MRRYQMLRRHRCGGRHSSSRSGRSRRARGSPLPKACPHAMPRLGGRQHRQVRLRQARLHHHAMARRCRPQQPSISHSRCTVHRHNVQNLHLRHPATCMTTHSLRRRHLRCHSRLHAGPRCRRVGSRLRGRHLRRSHAGVRRSRGINRSTRSDSLQSPGAG
jgi:hypothetical protein